MFEDCVHFRVHLHAIKLFIIRWSILISSIHLFHHNITEAKYGENEFYNIKFNFHLPLRMPFVCQSLVHFRVNPYFIRPFYFISASQHHRILKMVGLNHKYNIQYSLTITNTMCQKCVHFKVQPYVIKTLSSQRVRLNIIEPLISQGQSSLIKFIWNK